jgi:pimeloyl-ACP methyl ester carboxylesterase
MKSYFYLHGFASSPQSTKATYLRKAFDRRGIYLQTIDFNQGDFTHLTLTRQLRQLSTILPPQPRPAVLIGSSFGGLTAAWAAEQMLQIEQLVLLAPAFGFLDHWLPMLDLHRLQAWKDSGFTEVYHYGERRSLPLSYGFITDMQLYREELIQRPIPTLILHGRRDEVIPIRASQTFVASRPWVQLVELDSDHTLSNALPRIWQSIQQFCQC